MAGPTEHLTVELAAVWDEMFDAVAAILKSAEHINALAGSVPDAAAHGILEAVSGIFEACAFQDITGQRIAKVVAELAALDSDPAHMPEAPKARSANDDELLNGPQLPGNALDQDAIDDLFSACIVKA